MVARSTDACANERSTPWSIDRANLSLAHNTIIFCDFTKVCSLHYRPAVCMLINAKWHGIDDTRDTWAVSRYFVLLRYTAVYCDLGDTGIVAGVQTLRTQDTSDPRHFGPTEVQTQDTSAWPKCPDTSALVPKCLTDISALDILSNYSEDQSHCILCKGLLVNSRE